MTARERYLKTVLFDAPDKIPLSPGGPRESTLRAWHQQGLPEGANWFGTLLELIGVEPEPTQPAVDPGVSFRMIPEFEERVLRHEDGHYIVQDWMGAIVEISDEYDYTYLRAAKDFVTRKWHRFPVEGRADWERMKERYDPHTPGRFAGDFEQRCQALQERDCVAGIHFNGPFWQLREWCGMEGLCLLMADDPAFVHEMVDFWTDFVSATMAPVLQRGGATGRSPLLDRVGISEDMAFKAHSMISPAMTREFLAPAYRRWVAEARAAGCPIIDMDSDGYIAELIPIWVEVGINMCDPIEVAAGNDIVEYRRLHGRSMAYGAGIDKRAIAKGGKQMEAEVMRIVPPLLKDGGYIPGCDHGVPPDISWPNFIEYTRLLAKLTGWL